MSLTAGMWSGVSGLIAHGEKMNVVGNNIANINTVGFKGQRMDFEDYIYQDAYSSAGITQIGRGVGIGAIMGDFGQGSFESTTEVTDLAIGGRGFFKVSPAGSNTDYYTRAGNFRFDKAGHLNDPNGHTLQGWKINNAEAPERAAGGLAPTTNTTQIKGTGVPTDIKLDTWTVQPMQTTKVTVGMNLSKDNGTDSSKYTGHPFTSLLQNWNGEQPPVKNRPYISEDQFSGTPATIDVYDEAGGVHTLTVYFDKVDGADYGDSNPSEPMWEYLVTMDPADDMRKIAVPRHNPDGSPIIGADGKPECDIIDMKETSQAGVLMSGTMRFNSQGQAINMSGYVLNGSNKPDFVLNSSGEKEVVAGNGYALDPDGNPVPIMDPDNPAKYMYPTETSSAGLPMMVANFTAIPGAHSVGSVPDADKYLIELDLGLKVSNLESPWTNNGKSLAEANGESSVLLGDFMPLTEAQQAALQTAGFPADWESEDYFKTFTKRVENPDWKGNPGAGAATTQKTVPQYVYENPNYMGDEALLKWYNGHNGAGATAPTQQEVNRKAKYLGQTATITGAPPNATIAWSTGDAIPANDNTFKKLHKDTSTGGTPEYYYANTNYSDKDFLEVAWNGGDNNGAVAGDNQRLDDAEVIAKLRAMAKLHGGQVVIQIPVAGGTTTEIELDMSLTDAAIQGELDELQALSTTEKQQVKILRWEKGLNMEEVHPALASNLGEMTKPVIREQNAFTSTNGADNTINSISQNGYGSGDLTGYTVSGEGILSGTYSNGVTLPLYQIALYDFTCKQGLRREGGNLFSQTMASGDPSLARAGTSGFGTIQAQTLEGSNVDLSTQFVHMIATQRGFQSNSKLITTTDTMLETVINMKR